MRLTIDTEIQKLTNELLKDQAGSICVMDIYTGAVSMQSSPSFDPNLFVFGISKDDWQLIRNDPMKPLVNKTLQGNYSGSTIKPIVALSALENGIINTNFTVNCRGINIHLNYMVNLITVGKRGTWFYESEKCHETILRHLFL